MAADQISKTLRIGYGGECRIEEVPAGIRERLGGDTSELIASLGDMNAEMERALVFIQQ